LGGDNICIDVFGFGGAINPLQNFLTQTELADGATYTKVTSTQEEMPRLHLPIFGIELYTLPGKFKYHLCVLDIVAMCFTVDSAEDARIPKEEIVVCRQILIVHDSPESDDFEAGKRFRR
jgi:hypothetical protein